jgi:ClpP class serine protease
MRWAMLPEKLEAMIDMLEARARLGRPFTDEEIAQRVAGLSIAQTPHAAAAKPIRGKGGVVAILPLTGIIAPKASMVNGPSLPQGTACESFAAAFDEAMANEDVTHIVIDVDSPGGCVDGVPELAARIADARGKKPITAVANGMAASAAYWIASAADQIVVAPSGEVGSIGVYMVHFDFSEQLAQEGVTPTIIRAGQYKAEGNPLEPLTRRGESLRARADRRVLRDVRRRGCQAPERQQADGSERLRPGPHAARAERCRRRRRRSHRYARVSSGQARDLERRLPERASAGSRPKRQISKSQRD